MKSLLGQAVWLITALGCVHLGLIGLDINVLTYLPMNVETLIRPIHYVFGVAGILSLVMMMQSCSGGTCS